MRAALSSIVSGCFENLCSEGGDTYPKGAPPLLSAERQRGVTSCGQFPAASAVTHLGNAVDRDEIGAVFRHNLWREAFICWRLEETQNKGMLHVEHFSAAVKVSGTKTMLLYGLPSRAMPEANSSW